MTREEVVEIMNYSKEHKVTYKSRLEELNIPVWRFYDSKSRYAGEQSSGKTAQGEFIELPHSGSFVPVPSFAGTTGRKQKSTPTTPSGLKEIEIRTPAGSAIRICGELNEIRLRIVPIHKFATWFTECLQKNYYCPIKILQIYKIRADFIGEVSPFSLDFSRQTIKSNHGLKYTF